MTWGDRTVKSLPINRCGRVAKDNEKHLAKNIFWPIDCHEDIRFGAAFPEINYNNNRRVLQVRFIKRGAQ